MRSEERRLIKRKNRKQERREREEIEMCRSRNDAQRFCKNVKGLTEGFKPGAFSCRDARGSLVTDAQEVQRLWRYHFSSLLWGDGDVNFVTREDSATATIAITKSELR